MDALEFLIAVKRECTLVGCRKCRVTVQECPFSQLKDFSDEYLDGLVYNTAEIVQEEPINKWWE